MRKIKSYLIKLEAEELINVGKYDEALPLLLKAYESMDIGDKSQIESRIADCYIWFQNYIQAKKYLYKIIDDNPFDSEAIYRLALCHYHLNDFEKALDYFLKISPKKIEDGGNDILYYIGKSYLYDGEYDKAYEYLKELMNNEISPSTVYEIGVDLVKLGQYDKARQIFTEYLSISPKDYTALFGLGIVYSEQKEHYKAIECFKRVAGKKEDMFPSVFVSLAVSYLSIGDKINAKFYIDKAIIKNPTSYEAWFYYGVILESLGKLDEAIDALEKASDIKSDMYETWEKLGIVHLRKGSYKKAISNLKKAYALEKKKDFLYQIGLAYMMQKNYSKAIEYFNDSKDPKNLLMIYANLSVCYYYIRYYDRASEYAELFIESDIDLDSKLKVSNNLNKGFIYFVLGSSQMKLGNKTKARRYLEEGFNNFPNEVNLLYTLGILEGIENKYEKAIFYLERAIKIKETPEIIYAYALSNLKTGNRKIALEYLDRYKDIKSGDERALYKLAIIYLDFDILDKAYEAFTEVLKINPENEKANEYKDLIKIRIEKKKKTGESI